MTAIRGESFLLGGSWRGGAHRLDGRAPSGPIFGTAPWRVASTSLGSNNDFVASGLPGMVTNFLAPLQPSIIVTVLEPGGGVSSGFARGRRSIGWRGGCAVVAGMLPAIPVAVPSAHRGQRNLCGHHGNGLAAQRVIDESCPGHHDDPRKPQRACKQLGRGQRYVRQPPSLVLAEGGVQIVYQGARSPRIIARV